MYIYVLYKNMFQYVYMYTFANMYTYIYTYS